MAANTSPIFGLTSKTNAVATTGTGSTSLTAPTQLTTLYTAGTDGGMFVGANCKATGTTTAGMIRFWLTPNGGTRRLLGEVISPAVTPSGTVSSAEVQYLAPLMSLVNGMEGMPLASGDVVEVNTHNNETWNITCIAVNF
jgi:hypothetical protein